MLIRVRAAILQHIPKIFEVIDNHVCSTHLQFFFGFDVAKDGSARFRYRWRGVGARFDPRRRRLARQQLHA